ncbi:MAG: HEPN domain-containing protein [Candidatus Hydrogenedentota bacterium]
MQNNKIKAKEWFVKAEHDLATVKLIIKHKGQSDTAAVLLQQATEKYLKGYLLSKGWRLVKTHNLKKLLDESVKYDNRFEKFQDLAILLTGYYFEEKYPFSDIEITLKEIEDNLWDVRKLIALIKKSLKEKF